MREKDCGDGCFVQSETAFHVHRSADALAESRMFDRNSFISKRNRAAGSDATLLTNLCQ
jgi:hypothetical protein